MSVLPIARCTIAWRSVRYSTLPAFDSFTAWAMSIVTVPSFGFGILPCGPRTRPRRPAPPAPSAGADAAEAADHRHHVRGRDRDVEVGPALVLDALGEVLVADEVRTRVARLVG